MFGIIISSSLGWRLSESVRKEGESPSLTCAQPRLLDCGLEVKSALSKAHGKVCARPGFCSEKGSKLFTLFSFNLVRLMCPPVAIWRILNRGELLLFLLKGRFCMWEALVPSAACGSSPKDHVVVFKGLLDPFHFWMQLIPAAKHFLDKTACNIFWIVSNY